MPRRCAALPCRLALACAFFAAACGLPAHAQNPDKKSSQRPAQQRPLSTAEELQKAIADAGNDRTALVKNLRGFLAKFPDAQERPQIYRALVEACIQLHDNACATDYAERIVALTPEDTSITLLAIQLLQRSEDMAARRRALTYAGRVYESVKATPVSEKSPRVSLQEWEAQKSRDESAILALRGSIQESLKDPNAARKDFADSYALMPNAAAALKLGELAELEKDYNEAAINYARAFALSDTATKSSTRRDIRQKLGNVWRLAHGSEAGLGDFLLKTVDEVTAAAAPPRPRRNGDAKDPYAFVLRKAPDGTAFPLADQKGRVVVVNFWATWCGPCHALEPIYDRLAVRYAAQQDLVFLSANCDEDESLVAPYLSGRRSHTNEVFADGLERLFAVGSFPTVLILDRSGKVAFRQNGFDPDTIEQELVTAIQRVATGDAAHAAANQ